MRKRKKTQKSFLKFILTLLVIIGVLYACRDYIDYNVYISDAQNKVKQIKLELKAFRKEEPTQVDGKLQVYYIDVGQADSILVRNKDQVMLIDAGNNEDGELVSKYIKNLGIQKIDYLVGTHPHEDHIGGLDNIIKNFEIGTVYLPEITTNTKTYEEILDALIEKNVSITVPKISDKFNVGLSENEIIWVGNDSKNLNNCSIVIKTVYGNKSFLFTGDAEALVESKMSLSKCDVLKVGHHGSSTSTSETLLNKVEPKYAIISVGKNNDYGHPTKKTLDRLNKYGCEIHRTDEEGTILVSTDGENIEINSFETNTNG